MNWFKTFVFSTIGRKFVMSITGLFLCTFLVVHLIGNLLSYIPDEGHLFNLYGEFMSGNPLIRTIEIVLFLGFIFHILDGFLIAQANKKSRPIGYEGKAKVANASWASQNMGLLGTILFIFLVVHLQSFWIKLRFTGGTPHINIDGREVENLYLMLTEVFSHWWYSLLYLVAMLSLGYHLWHGFQSAFQTLGLNHKKYTPVIKFIGALFALIMTIGFASFPIVYYLKSLN